MRLGFRVRVSVGLGLGLGLRFNVRVKVMVKVQVRVRIMGPLFTSTNHENKKGKCEPGSEMIMF